jgi:hypothetical protein
MHIFWFTHVKQMFNSYLPTENYQMSELFTRAIDDLDGRAPGGVQDASRKLLDEVRRGADRYQLAAAVNQIEIQPGHAHIQLQVGQDSQGYLAFVPINGYPGDQRQPPPPPFEAAPPVIIQEYPNTVPVITAGALGLGLGLILGGRGRR